MISLLINYLRFEFSPTKVIQQGGIIKSISVIVNGKTVVVQKNPDSFEPGFSVIEIVYYLTTNLEEAV